MSRVLVSELQTAIVPDGQQRGCHLGPGAERSVSVERRRLELQPQGVGSGRVEHCKRVGAREREEFVHGGED